MAARAGVRLIVSVDTGIRAAQVVARAAELGIDVVITDHHLPEAELPPALAVLNPNRPGCGYPEKNLCGVGVAFKLVQGLMETLGWTPDKVRRTTESFLKMVAIGTVADVVPLTGENRVIVKHGLDGLRKVRNPGLRALLDVRRLHRAPCPPRRRWLSASRRGINAAGRMDTANAVIEMFLTGDVERARALAAAVARSEDGTAAGGGGDGGFVPAPALRGRARRRWCSAVRTGIAACSASWPAAWWSVIIARLSCSGRSEDGLVQGSGRSIHKFHLLEALEVDARAVLKFGGHTHAAGLTMRADRVEEFRARFHAHAASRLTRRTSCRGWRSTRSSISPRSTTAASPKIFRLAPFGCGNPAPVFAALGSGGAGAAGDLEGKAPARAAETERASVQPDRMEFRRTPSGNRCRRPA